MKMCLQEVLKGLNCFYEFRLLLFSKQAPGIISVKMKFVLKCANDNGARRGVLSAIERLPNFKMETPSILIHTQSGSVPHLTPDVISFLKPQPEGILLTVPTLTGMMDRMRDSPMTVAEFVGLRHLATFASVIDPGKPRLEGFHKKDIVAVQTRQGKRELTSDFYMDLMDALRPDVFLALCDGDTTCNSSKKRVSKSMSRSKEMLSQCEARWRLSEKLKSSTMLVPLEGGVEPESRRSYVDSVISSINCGVVIDGLGQYGQEVAERSVKKYSNAIRASLENVTPDKLRVLHGAWHPREIFDLIELGIDILDTSYAYLATERGVALILPIQQDVQPPTKRMKPQSFEISLHDDEGLNISIRNSLMDQIEATAQICFVCDHNYPKNAEKFEPISPGCSCHCCQNHTKAYIHHLLNVKELLATVLLSIHNTQQYLELFNAIRQSIDDGTFNSLKERFQ